MINKLYCKKRYVKLPTTRIRYPVRCNGVHAHDGAVVRTSSSGSSGEHMLVQWYAHGTVELNAQVQRLVPWPLNATQGANVRATLMASSTHKHCKKQSQFCPGIRQAMNKTSGGSAGK